MTRAELQSAFIASLDIMNVYYDSVLDLSKYIKLGWLDHSRRNKLVRF